MGHVSNWRALFLTGIRASRYQNQLQKLFDFHNKGLKRRVRFPDYSMATRWCRQRHSVYHIPRASVTLRPSRWSQLIAHALGSSTCLIAAKISGDKQRTEVRAALIQKGGSCRYSRSSVCFVTFHSSRSSFAPLSVSERLHLLACGTRKAISPKLLCWQMIKELVQQFKAEIYF